MKLSIELPDDLAIALNMDEENLERDIRLFAAIKLYEIGKLSIGKASELANVNKIKFIELLGDYNIPTVDYPPDELDEELNLMKEV